MLDERKIVKILMLILAFALVLRIFLIIIPEVIHNDGIEYIRHAKQISSGIWTGGKAPPLYPALIAFAYPFTRNYEIAGILISIILGTLIVFPVFYLGRELFNERIGIVSAIFASVHPFLYIYSGSVLTESAYYFLLTTSVLFGWRTFHQGKLRHLLLFSLFTTLAFLTKPEAIGFLLIVCVWVLLIHPLDEKRLWGKRIGIIFLTALSFVIFSAPYLIQIRKETGKWNITKKVDISIGFHSKDDKESYSLEAVKKEKGIQLISLIEDPLAFLKRTGKGLLKSFYLFSQVYHPLLFALAILGWIGISKKRSTSGLKENFYILSYHVFFFAFVFPIFYFGRRYVSQMVAISLPWAAFGFLEMIKWGNERFSGRRWQTHLPTILLILVLLLLFIQGGVLHLKNHYLIRKEAGLWMRDHLPKEAKVMSRLPQEAFYAELPWAQLPEWSYEEILETARSNKIQYIIIDESIEKESPGFWRNIKQEDLMPLKEWKHKTQSLVIFEIVYPRQKGNGESS